VVAIRKRIELITAMATVVSQYSTTGFYRAPVSKGLMGVLFITCTAINVPLLSHLRQYLVCRLPDAILEGELWRLLMAKTAFLETRDLICASLLIYSFRVFERRFGSRKFASHLMASSLISLVLETTAVLLIKSSRWSSYHNGYLSPGLYGLVFPLFVPYLFNIPRITRSHMLGIPVTAKTLTYLVGLQVCSTSIPTAVTSLCSISAGFLYRWNFARVQQWLVIPSWMAKICGVTLGSLLASSAPVDGPMGATLDIQRQEQTERLEQQIILQRSRDSRQVRQNTGQGYAERLVGPEMSWGNPAAANGMQQQRRRLFGNNLPNFNANANARENIIQEPSEENITFLTEMGFSREQVLRALNSTANNVEAATNLLLQDH